MAIRSRNPLIAVVRAYQRVISPWLGPRCRFHPTCSRYAVEAMERFGPIRGGVLAFFRIARCNAFFEGGIDPIPAIFPRRPWRRATQRDDAHPHEADPKESGPNESRQ